MNPNRKCKNFHINYTGHYSISLPFEVTKLCYCEEVGEEGNPHTHCGFQTVESISKNEIIKQLTPLLEIECSLEVSVHKNYESIIGYHLGFGDKARCTDPGLQVVFPSDFDCDNYIRNKIMHRPLKTCQQVKEKNLMLLDKKPVEALRDGDIHLRGYSQYKKDWNEAITDIGFQLNIKEDRIIAPKFRHFWFWGKSNTGKTTFGKEMAKAAGEEYFMMPRNNDWKNYRDQKYIIIDEFKKGRIKIDELQEMVDADQYQVNVKGSSKNLRSDCIFIITCRCDPKFIFVDEDIEDVEGILNRFSVKEFTFVYPRN